MPCGDPKLNTSHALKAGPLLETRWIHKRLSPPQKSGFTSKQPGVSILIGGEGGGYILIGFCSAPSSEAKESGLGISSEGLEVFAEVEGCDQRPYGQHGVGPSDESRWLLGKTALKQKRVQGQGR